MRRSDESAPVPTPTRWWRLSPWCRNHLMRPSDRAEAAVILITAVLILLAIPFAAAFGTATHARLEQQTRALRADEQQVPAVLLEDTHPASDTPEDALRPTGTKDSARARWTTPHGEHTGIVPTDTPAKAGQTITISIDADGNLTGPIPTDGQNTVLAATAACGVWALSAGALLVPITLTRTLLRRKRLRQWAYEWKQLDTPSG